MTASCVGSTSSPPPALDASPPIDASPEVDSGRDGTVPPPSSEAGVDAAAPVDSSVELDAAPEAGSSHDGGHDALVSVDAAPDSESDSATPDGGASSSDSGADGMATTDASLDSSSAEAGADGGAQWDSGLDAGVVILTISGGENNKITLADGVPLYIGDTHAAWSYGDASVVTYQNLPPALIGTVGNDTVNNGSLVSFTLSASTTCYLLRQVNWTAVSLTGWSEYATAAYYFDGYQNMGYGTAEIYSQTFPAGTYQWSTFSGMYACAAK